MHAEIAIYSTSAPSLKTCLDAILSAGVTSAPITVFSSVDIDINHDISQFSFCKTANKNAFISTAMQATKSQHVLFLDDSTHIHPDFFDNLPSQSDAAVLVPRTLPYDTTHHMDPCTLQLSLFSRMPFILQKDSFFEVGQWQSALPFEYACLEYSLRLQSRQKTIHYLPKCTASLATTQDFSGENLQEVYLNTEKSRLLLSYVYGGVFAAHRAFFDTLKHPRHFAGVRKSLLKTYLAHFSAVPSLLSFKKHLVTKNMQKAKDTALSFSRGDYPLQPAENLPNISVVIRTHKRTDALRRALQSVENQTYPAAQVIIIEDGEAHSKDMVNAEFSHLPIEYHATKTPIGRSKAGNLGLSMAKSEYCNFLDDDDYFYPDHLEYMATQAALHPDADLVLGASVAVRQNKDTPLVFADLELIHFDRLNVFTMSQMCQIPILSVCFKRSLYQKHGGLAEDMHAHEDWSMWLRFLSSAQRINKKTIDISRATSIFSQPYSDTEANRRISEYMEYDDVLFQNDDIRFSVSLAEMRMFYDDMLGDIKHLQNNGQLDSFLEKEQNRTKPPV